MPIAMDPNKTFEVALESDMEVPQATRPVFIFRYMTARQWAKALEIRETYMKADRKTASVEELVQPPFEIIRLALSGWKNIRDTSGCEIAFEPAKLEDILTEVESMELMFKCMNQTPTVEDKKKLESQSPCDTAESVTNAPE